MDSFKRVRKAIEEIKKGNMVIMLDDEDRENEGDIVYVATLSTPQKVNFCATYAKGLICVAMPSSSAKRLQLDPMVKDNSSSYETAFTISVDSKNAKTGISAYERDETIKILANPLSKPDDLVRPGHIFPLIAKDGGVLVRTGHTEGSVDLCKMAGFSGEAVICEIMKEDGTMARRDDLDIFAKKYNLVQVFISDLIEYRLAYESLIKKINTQVIEFFGVKCQKIEFLDHLDNTHYAVIFDKNKDVVPVKFHLIEPDINTLLNTNKLNSFLKSIEYLKKNGGVIIFLSTKNKQDDSKIRDFGIGAQILNKLEIKNINLITSRGKHSFIGLKGFDLTIQKEINI